MSFDVYSLHIFQPKVNIKSFLYIKIIKPDTSKKLETKCILNFQPFQKIYKF